MRDTSSPPITTNRETDIYYAYIEGKTLAEIGEQHGITRERVRQLLKKQGVNRRSATETATVRHRRIRTEMSGTITDTYRETGSITATVERLKSSVPKSVVKSVIDEMPEDERESYKRRPSKERVFDDTSMKAALNAAAAEGAVTISAYRAWKQTPAGSNAPSVALLIMRYGSWKQALAAAGIHGSTTVGPGKTFTDAEILGAVKRFVDACEASGKYPSSHQYDQWAKAVKSVPTLSTVRTRTNSTWLEVVSAARNLK